MVAILPPSFFMLRDIAFIPLPAYGGEVTHLFPSSNLANLFVNPALAYWVFTDLDKVHEIKSEVWLKRGFLLGTSGEWVFSSPVLIRPSRDQEMIPWFDIPNVVANDAIAGQIKASKGWRWGQKVSEQKYNLIIRALS